MTTLEVRFLSTQDYQTTWHAMRDWTVQRTATTPDQLWVMEHPPVFTQGQAGKAEHVLDPGDIPVVQTDRGGQVTYHGPGQLVIYTLIDLTRRKTGVRGLVTALEQAVIATLNNYGITATADPKARGVYVSRAKICSLGLRVKRGCSYHGLALNVAMDLEPFNRINPCGYENLPVTQISNFPNTPDNIMTVADDLIPHIQAKLGYNQLSFLK